MSETKQKPSVGRIVIVQQGEGNDATPLPLPNGMEVCAAIVTQVINEEYINATGFLANPRGEPTIQFWTVPHKDNATNGQSYWDWPARV